MRDFIRDRKFGKIDPMRRNSSGNDDRNPRRFERGPDRSERRDFEKSDFEKKRFPANCDKCGDRCELPFKPTGEKPVYCSNCFRKNEKFESKSRFKGERFAATSSDGEFGKELFEMNKKLDLILEALTKR